MDVKPSCPTCKDKPAAEKKKVVGDFFTRPYTTWNKYECVAFLDLSETVQKRLPDFRTAGKAKSAVLRHLTSLMDEPHPTAPLLSAPNLQMPDFILIIHLFVGLIENISSQQQPPQPLPLLPAVITGDTSRIDSYIQELKLAIHMATQQQAQLPTEEVQLNVSNSNDAPQ
jgi:hypothetical protein